MTLDTAAEADVPATADRPDAVSRRAGLTTFYNMTSELFWILGWTLGAGALVNAFVNREVTDPAFKLVVFSSALIVLAVIFRIAVRKADRRVSALRDGVTLEAEDLPTKLLGAVFAVWAWGVLFLFGSAVLHFTAFVMTLG